MPRRASARKPSIRATSASASGSWPRSASISALYRRGLTLEAARAEIEALRGQVSDADADVALMLGFLADARRGIVR